MNRSNVSRVKKSRYQTGLTLLSVVAQLSLIVYTSGIGLLLSTRTAAAATTPQAPSTTLNVNIDLDQWADHAPGFWHNGNLNGSNSSYHEGESVPFRLQITGLDSGHTQKVRIRYDYIKSGVNAYDYLKTFNADRTPTGIPAGTPVTAAIPADAGLPFTPDAGLFTLYGGTFGTITGPTIDGTEKYYDIVITGGTGTTETLFWGGHIASANDWGVGNGASSISGSSFHMAISKVSASGGESSSQDRSIQVGAILPPTTGTVTVNKKVDTDRDGTYEGGNTEANALGFRWGLDAGTADLLMGTTAADVLNGNHAVTENTITDYHFVGWFPTGSTQYSCANPQGTALPVAIAVSGGVNTNVTLCNAKNAPVPGSLLLTKVVDSGSASTDSFSFTIDPDPNGVGTVHPSGGTYLFDNLPAGSYTVTEAAYTGYHEASNTCGNVAVTSGQQASCAIHNAVNTGTVTLQKIVQGGSALPGDWSFTVNGVPGYHSGDQITLPIGDYPITESGPSDYSLTGVAGVCDLTAGAAPMLHVTVDGGTCTFTNTRDTGSLTVIKHVINDNGGTRAAGDFTMHVSGDSVSNPSFPGSETGTTVTLNTGSYSVDENFTDGYTKILGSDCSGTIAKGEHKTCTITNDDQAASLTVIKHVINDNGGSKAASDFTMNVSGTNVSTPSFPGSESGTTVTLNAGSYSVDESAMTGYAKSLGANCSGTIANGESKTCTITNDDEAASITLLKNVINDSGGTAGVNDFGLIIGNTPVSSGQVLPVNAHTAYALNEAGLTGYQFVSITGDENCPEVLGGTVTLTEGEDITCTITNNDIQPHLTVYKYVINQNGATLLPSDFTLHVSGTDVSPATFPGSDTGTLVSLDQGSYTVTEDPVSGYTPAYSPDCTGSIQIGQSKTCIVTNTSQDAHLIVVKHVVNDNGGTKSAPDFSLTINGVAVPSGATFPGAEAPGTDKVVYPGAYSVSEAPDSQYAVSYSSDCSGSISLGQTKICTVTNDDVQPRLTVTKIVINDNGGNKVVSDFPLYVGAIQVTSGQENGFDAGGYVVSELGQPGYSAAITGDCDQNGSISLTAGDVKHCTITNNDIAPTITLVKSVINDNGGTAGPNDFGLTIGNTPVSSGQVLPVNAHTSYPLNEAGLLGYSFDSIAGDENCPEVLGGTVTLNEGETLVCTIINTRDVGNVLVNKLVDADGNGTFESGNADANALGFAWGFDNGAVNRPMGSSISGVETGTHSITENSVPGYHFVGWYQVADPNVVAVDIGAFADDQVVHSCSNPEGDSLPAAFDVMKDQTATIVLCNTRDTGTIVVHKDVVRPDGVTPVDDDHGFTVTLDGGNQQPVSESTTATYDNVPTGNHTITELTDPNYELVSITGDGSVDVVSGETTPVYVVNKQKPATIVLVKDVRAWDGSDIADATPFSVTLNSETKSFAEGLKAAFTVDPGTYTAVETGNPDYLIGSYSPSDTATVGSNETAEITVSNIQNRYAVQLEKTGPATATPDSDITYTLNWSNAGTAPIANLTLTDPLPVNTTFVSASDGGTEAAGIVTWNLGYRLPGATGSVTLTVHIPTPIDNGTVIPNAAQLCGTAGQIEDRLLLDEVQYCDSGETTTTVTSAASLGLTKTATEQVAPGGTISYTLAWSVSGNTPITNLVLTDPVPTNTVFVSASDGGTEAAGIVTWNLGNHVPGDSGTVTLTVTASDDLTNDQTLKNTAALTADELDPVEANATTTVVAAPILAITKTVNVTTFSNPGKTVAYTIVVSNIGNDTAKNVMLIDALPNGLTFADTGSTTLTVPLGDLAKGASVTKTYSVVIAATAKAGFYDNVAVAEADNAPSVSASARVEIRLAEVAGETAPELKITKTADRAFANPGNVIKYTITVTNVGTAVAKDVVVKDTLPSGLAFTDTTGSTRTWSIGDLAVNAKHVITVTAKVAGSAKAGILTNTASVTATDLNPVKATATVDIKIPQVLGALTETGASPLDLVIGFIAALFVLMGLSLFINARPRAEQSKP